MTNLRRRALIGLAAPVAGAVLAHGDHDHAPQKKWKELPAREQIRQKHFPNVLLKAHDGRVLRFYDDLLRGKIVMINFMYIACGDGTCPLTTVTLRKVQQMLGPRAGRDVFMYSISLNPEYDTQEALAAYAKAFEVGPGWLFLTGAPADIERLRRSLGFYDRDPVADADKTQHVAMVRIGNERRQLWSMASALLSPESMIKSLESVQ
ncbi:MAG TPA: SCO family protein [Ramlibacter sp.]|nr:SCO family protein [Ramlibacter sp.]